MDVFGNTRVLDSLLGDIDKRTRSEHIVRIVFMPPCAYGGVYQAGVLEGLAERGACDDHFHVVGGASAGSWNAMAFVSGQAHMVPTFYTTLVAMYPTLALQGDLLGLSFLSQSLQGNIYPDPDIRLATDRIHESSTQSLIVTSDGDGRPIIHEVKNSPHTVFELCEASSNIPIFAPGKSLGGIVEYDGACAHPCPLFRIIRTAVRERKEVHILIVHGRPHPKHQGPMENFVYSQFALWSMWSLGFSNGITQNTSAFTEKMHKVFDMCDKRRQRIQMCALAPSAGQSITTLASFTAPCVQIAGEAGREDVLRLLDQ